MKTLARTFPGALRFFSVMLLACAPLGSRADQIIYDDALANGWQDYGWAVLNSTNPSPVHSGSKSISVTAGAYQALYVHHAAFDSSGFTNLAFWIHGGATGGQSLQVQAQLNGVAQPAVNLPALTTNWQQFIITLPTLGAANQPNLDGFWIQSRVGSPIPTFYVDDLRLTSVALPSVVNLSLNAAATVRTVDARMFGLNAAIWDAVFDTTNTVGLLKDIDNQVLRFPGGSQSDEYHWATGRSGTNAWAWATSFSNFLHVATNTRAQVFITVNYGSGTPAEAAAWVRHANITNALAFKYWEVGNENYGSWETDTNARPHDAWTYANRFKTYYTQMKAADPAIKIGAVVVTGEDQYANYTDHPATNSRTLAVHHGWTPVLLATLKTNGITPDFLIYHRYEQGPGGEDDAALLQSAKSWTNDAAGLRQQLNDYLGAAATNVELVVTENNSVYSNPGKQSTSLVNGLYLADSLGNLLQTEFNACVWWALRNSQDFGNNNSPSLYGWRNHGDYGITDGSNPSTPTNRYPTFYVLKLLKKFARGGDRTVRATSDHPLLSAYAAARTDGTLALLVINKHPTTNFAANLALTGWLPGSNVTLHAYGIPQDEAARTGTGSGDVAQTHLVLNPAATNLALTFAPYSANVLVFLPPRLGILPVGMSNGQANLRILGQPGLRYELQVTSNLAAWPSLLTNTLGADALDWTDPATLGVGARFYRARWLP